MVQRVKFTGDYESALYSAGGTVQAASEIWQSKINNAFVFTSFGDHHAGRDFYGGVCYSNGAALAITALKERGVKLLAMGQFDIKVSPTFWSEIALTAEGVPERSLR